jgi:hypothetical protein
MASIFLKYYADVEKTSDAAVKKNYGVSKANVLKVLETLLVADLGAASGKKTSAGTTAKRGPKKKPGRKPGKKRGRKPGRKPLLAKKPGKKRGRKPGVRLASSPRIEVS